MVDTTDADRVENIRRVAEVARLMVDAGLIVLASFISPFRAERRMARELLGDGEFVEVHVDVPLAVAEGRDRKGLYAKARRGDLVHFTGIDSPYEPPESPEVYLDASGALPRRRRPNWSSNTSAQPASSDERTPSCAGGASRPGPGCLTMRFFYHHTETNGTDSDPPDAGAIPEVAAAASARAHDDVGARGPSA